MHNYIRNRRCKDIVTIFISVVKLLLSPTPTPYVAAQDYLVPINISRLLINVRLYLVARQSLSNMLHTSECGVYSTIHRDLPEKKQLFNQSGGRGRVGAVSRESLREKKGGNNSQFVSILDIYEVLNYTYVNEYLFHYITMSVFKYYTTVLPVYNDNWYTILELLIHESSLSRSLMSGTKLTCSQIRLHPLFKMNTKPVT